jgi:hypothetical protein
MKEYKNKKDEEIILSKKQYKNIHHIIDIMANMKILNDGDYEIGPNNGIKMKYEIYEKIHKKYLEYHRFNPKDIPISSFEIYLSLIG